MALFRGLVKGAIASFAVKQARKPENQARLKGAFRSLTGKGGSPAGSRGTPRRAASARRG